MHGGAVLAARPVNTRSAVTNDPKRLSADIDKRSIDGRLFCDLFDSVAAEFPGADSSKVRSLALLKFELERARAAGTLTLEDTVRVHHLIGRHENALRLALRQRAVAQQSTDMRGTLRARYSKAPGP
jgi:hypothetical protein